MIGSLRPRRAAALKFCGRRSRKRVATSFNLVRNGRSHGGVLPAKPVPARDLGEQLTGALQFGFRLSPMSGLL